MKSNPNGDGRTLAHLPLDRIDPNPHQPRSHFDGEALADLAQSIRDYGVLQPIEVEAAPDGRYILHHGERRLRAARIARLATIPALIAPARGDREAAVLAIVENLHRADLNPVEEGIAYRRLLDAGLTRDAIARKTGRSSATISGRLMLLELDPELQELVVAGRLSCLPDLTRALLAIPDPAARVELGRRLASNGVSHKGSVAAAERLAQRLAEKAAGEALGEHPTPMLRHARVRRTPVVVTGPQVKAAADAMCGACSLRPESFPSPAWAAVEKKAAATCEKCQKHNGPAMPMVCRECPGVKLIQLLAQEATP